MNYEIIKFIDNPVKRLVGSFLSDVITPIYELYKNEKGDLYTKYKNYDDMNEFFWSKSCLKYYFGKIKYNKYFNDIEMNNSNLISISDGMKLSNKTFLEKRSW
jgi:hypothetical protein